MWSTACSIVRYGFVSYSIQRQGAPGAHLGARLALALRWAPTEAVQKIPAGGGPLRAMFERIAKRRGRKIAKVAVARQILTLC